MSQPHAREIALPEASPERDANRLLASANLLRIRGRWDEAVEQCMAAMRLAPDSATAQSLLGDIYENQGRTDDAVQWYRMALDVNPDSPADKVKLGRLLEAKTLESRVMDAPIPATLAPAGPPPARKPRRIEPDAALRGAAFAAGLLVLVIVALALMVMARHGPLRPGSKIARQINTDPVVLAPPAASSPSAPALPPASGHDPLEQSLMERLRATGEFADADLTLMDLQSDPRVARLVITVAVRPISTGGASREWVLRQALRALQAAAREVDPQTASLFTIRCLLAPTEAASGLSTPLVFVGDAPRAALVLLGADSATLSAPQMRDAFQAAWWSPIVPS